MLLPALVLLCFSCARTRTENQGYVSDLVVPRNYTSDRIDLDYSDALNGFTIPSVEQAAGGVFTFSFRAHDPAGKGRPLQYKLYWRNESYKQPEANADGTEHPLAQENFYGSWCSGAEDFHSTLPTGKDGVLVMDSFRIIGDPRDEPQYVVNGTRHREGRNPRTGDYSFLLVVMPAEQCARLPQAVADIRVQADGRYTEPYWYFLSGPGAQDTAIQVLRGPRMLHVTARPPLSAGIHVTPSDWMPRDAFCATCGDDSVLMRHAAFEQFIHYVDPTTGFDNIPLIADVLGNAYTPEDYDRDRAFFPKERMVHARPSTTLAPCTSVRFDSLSNAIELRNPASTEQDRRKENVGVRTRHALQYGRYRIHCQLTRLLNDSDLWDGLTNAIWLLSDSTPWSLRRPCNGGYLAHYYGGAHDQRVDRSNYAEIDFEILKTPPYCPERSFPPVYPEPIANAQDRNAWSRRMPSDRVASRGMITVACTNWDMACPQPSAFASGCAPIIYQDSTYWSHRWTKDYRAITQKSEAPDKALFGDDYWFEIDWRPTEIIWRVGPDPEHMRVVGYMDGSMTEIPDVPMRLLVTQEYHNTRWWPGSPYEQGFIPFPAKDYVGRIYEVTVD